LKLSDGTKEEEGMSAIINMLVEKFPNAFFIYEGRRKPLKLKIHHDILEVMDIDPAELSAAMRIYTSNLAYLRASVEGAARVDLNGCEAGLVTAEQAVNAAKALAGRMAARKKRRSAREWAEVWARRAAAKPAPKPAAAAPPEPKPASPAARGLGFAGLREAARARKAAAEQQPH
jgi:ProP effector